MTKSMDATINIEDALYAKAAPLVHVKSKQSQQKNRLERLETLTMACPSEQQTLEKCTDLQGRVIQELDRHSKPLWQHKGAQDPGLNEPINPFFHSWKECDVTSIHVDVEAERRHLYQRYLQSRHA